MLWYLHDQPESPEPPLQISTLFEKEFDFPNQNKFGCAFFESERSIKNDPTRVNYRSIKQSDFYLEDGCEVKEQSLFLDKSQSSSGVKVSDYDEEQELDSEDDFSDEGDAQENAYHLEKFNLINKVAAELNTSKMDAMDYLSNLSSGNIIGGNSDGSGYRGGDAKNQQSNLETGVEDEEFTITPIITSGDDESVENYN